MVYLMRSRKSARDARLSGAAGAPRFVRGVARGAAADRAVRRRHDCRHRCGLRAQSSRHQPHGGLSAGAVRRESSRATARSSRRCIARIACGCRSRNSSGRAGGGYRERRPQLLPASRRRLRRHRARCVRRSHASAIPRRLDDHAAAGTQACFLNDEVSMSRKIQEALLAMEIERYYTKDEILERYLNMIYLGCRRIWRRRGCTHVLRRVAFTSSPCAQAAMLAGVIAAPSDYSPFANLEARARTPAPRARSHGRKRLYHAAASRLMPKLPRSNSRANAPRDCKAMSHPYFTTYVIAQLEKLVRQTSRRRRRPASLHALDPRMQQIAQEAVTGASVQAAQRRHQRASSSARCDSSVDGRDRRDGRRHAFFAGQSVQPRMASASPARFVV